MHRVWYQFAALFYYSAKFPKPARPSLHHRLRNYVRCRWRLLPGHFVLHVPHASTSSAAQNFANELGWDVATTPLALMKIKMREVEAQPEFRRHVVQAVPSQVRA